MKITIEPACLRDASYVMANMRPLDALEALCQVPDGVRIHELAHWLISGSAAYVAYVDGRPSAIFGTSPINVVCLSIWALGTKRMRRCIPAITRFMIAEHLPERAAEGYKLMEARSLVQHEEAHRWMQSTGAVVQGDDFEYGKEGEMFRLFRWEARSLPAATRHFLRRGKTT